MPLKSGLAWLEAMLPRMPAPGYIQDMIPQGALVLYHGKPAFVASRDMDRLLVRLQDGSSQKVRDKDLVLMDSGPVTALPLPAEGGDFETARAMLGEGYPAGWSELSELVFGEAGPSQALACYLEARKGLCFALDEGLPRPMSEQEMAAASRKLKEKENEESARADFVRRAASGALQGCGAIDARETRESADAPASADAKYLSELEALAFGRSPKSRTARDLGIPESMEAAHAFLLKAGIWTDTVNPWPQRAGCPLSPVKLALPTTPLDDEYERGRADLRRLASFAIDNEGSHDPDDAVSYDPADGRIWVHVADPASVITPGSPVDEEALARGATLYLPEKIVPMLPEEAVARFGLGLSESSPALSFGIRLAPDASIDSVEILASTVRVRRLTYGQADGMLSDQTDLAALDALAALRRTRRIANGAVEIEIPEVSHRVREGKVEIVRYAHTRSSQIVREMMLLAGEAAARWAFERALPFPFYGQEPPQLSEEIRLDPETGDAPLSVQYARRRGMRPGMLGPSPTAHRGLGLPFYAQVTSPLRRYQDLLCHYQIRASLSAGRTAPMDADEISRRCAAASAAGAPNRQAERDSERFWTAVFLARNPGWRGTAIPVHSLGAEVLALIPELGIETKIRVKDADLDVPIEVALSRVSLPDASIVFSPEGKH